jgi:hypothetical protein
MPTINANLPLHARPAGPAMKGKTGTAAGRSINVEPTKILFSGDGPALTQSPFVGASFQLLNGTREKTGTIWAISDFVASRWGGLPRSEHRKIGSSSIGDYDESTDIDRGRRRCGRFSRA